MLTKRTALVVVLGIVGIVAVSTVFVSQPGSLWPGKVLRRAAKAARDPAAPLQFRGDGSFQLAIFEDLHFGENAWDQWGPQQDLNSVRVIEAVLDAEQPDLVVLNGDLITGENAFHENSTVYVDQIVAPMVHRRVPWASTYGNHDSDFNLSRAALLAREQQQKPAGLARTANMISGLGLGPGLSSDSDSGPHPGQDRGVARRTGVTNYYLPVYGSDCPLPTTAAGTRAAAVDIADRCVPRLLLWFFDSRGGFHYQQTNAATGQRVGQEDWVDASVVAWFEQTLAALQAKYSALSSNSSSSSAIVIPSLAFVHIPPNVSYALQMDDAGGARGGIDPHRQPGVNDDKPLAQQAQGWCPDGTNGGGGAADCAYGGQDEPFMRAIAAAGNGTGVVALFSGHDHGDTWCHTWDAGRALPGVNVPGTGVHICFGQHSGYGGYGTWTRGARQVRVTEVSLQRAAAASPRRRADVDTWIRLETGAVVGQVALNATYGRDVYPATPNTHTHCPTCEYAVKSGAAATKKKPSLWGGGSGSGLDSGPGSDSRKKAGSVVAADAQPPKLQVQQQQHWRQYLGWPAAA